MTEKSRRELGKEERSCDVLATVSAPPARCGHGDDVEKMAKGPHLRLVWLSDGDDEARGVLEELWAEAG